MDVHKVKGPYEAFIKRFLDIVISLLVLTLFCWLYAIIAILVMVKLGSPVIFAQDRPGKIDSKTGKEKIFKLYKFRSMTDEKDNNGILLPDVERLTPFGRKLRASSLDELPEIFNILKGDMSLVGPRPLAVSYLPFYSQAERKRHCVRPGLTGLAQINGRNTVAWERRFAYDTEYVNNVSFLMDLKIIVRTIIAVIRKEGIGQAEDAPESFSVVRKQQLANSSQPDENIK